MRKASRRGQNTTHKGPPSQQSAPARNPVDSSFGPAVTVCRSTVSYCEFLVCGPRIPLGHLLACGRVLTHPGSRWHSNWVGALGATFLGTSVGLGSSCCFPPGHSLWNRTRDLHSLGITARWGGGGIQQNGPCGLAFPRYTPADLYRALQPPLPLPPPPHELPGVGPSR